jgi:hypothetical protein
MGDRGRAASPSKPLFIAIQFAVLGCGGKVMLLIPVHVEAVF